jgi:hypothetical protein
MKINNLCLNNKLLLYFQVQDVIKKNHSEKDNPNDTIDEGRMYERLEDLMCPVKSYLKYVSKLHPENMAFWQQPSDSYDDISSVWYTKTPIGKNNLSTMMVKLSKLSKQDEL